MDTFENNDLTPEETPVVCTPEETTSYHAEGVGQREQIGGNAFDAYHQNSAPAEPWEKPPKSKKAGKIIGRIVCVILAIAVLVGGCTVSSFLTARAWQAYYDAMLPGMIQQAVQDAVAGIELPTVPEDTTDVIVTVEGFSATEVYQQNVDSVV